MPTVENCASLFQGFLKVKNSPPSPPSFAENAKKTKRILAFFACLASLAPDCLDGMSCCTPGCQEGREADFKKAGIPALEKAQFSTALGMADVCAAFAQ
jgi:hypothetical protein